MNRDDFSNPTAELLARRVGYRCSNPNCGRSTIGPNDNPQTFTKIGEAAHICAAAPGGPRYNSVMTSEERSSASNGIWLCKNCARLIDRDTRKYTIELLKSWKEEAERKASLEISTKHGADGLLPAIGTLPKIKTWNESYAEDFEKPLFFHQNQSKVCLKNLFVLQKYRDASIKGDPVMDLWDRIGAFVQNRFQEMLILEGDAGCGKTSLVQALCWHAREHDSIEERVLGGRPLVTVRLRELDKEKITEKDGLLVALLDALGIPVGEIQQRKKILLERFPRAVLVLDGFDELCIIEGLWDYERLLFRLTGERLQNWRFVITSRPNYIRRGLHIPGSVIELQHFDREKREEWLCNYTDKNICAQTLRKDLEEYILEGTEEGVCDTPLTLYLLAAGDVGLEDRQNLWRLYHRLFSRELTRRKYDKAFHPGEEYSTAAYRLAESIAWRMYQGGNKRLYLRYEEIESIADNLLEDPDLRQTLGNEVKARTLAERNAGLCCYLKSMEDRGAVEFYHNNIRDFYLAEKIYWEINQIYQNADSLEGKINALIDFFRDKLRPGIIVDRVCQFLYLRVCSEINDGKRSISHMEQEQLLCPKLFQRLLGDGRIYDGMGEKRLIPTIVRILSNAVDLYWAIREPLRQEGERHLWWLDVEEINDSGLLRFVFQDIFGSHISPIFTFHPGAFGCFSGVSLSYGDLKGINMQGSNLQGAQIQGVNFQQAIIQNADLRDADLYGANMRKADLRNANMQRMDLRSTDFNGANLQLVNLTESDMTQSTLVGANMIGSILRGITFPDGYHHTSKEEFDPKEYLQNLHIDALQV